MSDDTESIVELQQKISTRLAELGHADLHSAQTVSRHLAEIAVLGRRFADATLPLFLTMNRDNANAIARLVLSMKCDLDELRDALIDVAHEMGELTKFVNPTISQD